MRDFEVYTWKDLNENRSDTVYSKEWYSKILLKKKLPIRDYDDSYYRRPGVSEDKLKNQIPYSKSLKKEFYEFKLIEIESETTMKEHLSFVHCVQPGQVQFMYFSDDLKYMYER